MVDLKRIYRLAVALLAFLLVAPVPLLSMGIMSVIGLSIEESIPPEYWALYWGAVLPLGLVALFLMRKLYPDKIPKKLRAKKRIKDTD